MPLGRSKSVLRSLLTFYADQLEWCSPRRLHSVSTYNIRSGVGLFFKRVVDFSLVHCEGLW